jgi:hypothetical protein
MVNNFSILDFPPGLGVIMNGTIITVKKDGTINFETCLCDEKQVQIILPLETNMAMKWAMSWLGKTFLRQIVPTFFKKS